MAANSRAAVYNGFLIEMVAYVHVRATTSYKLYDLEHILHLD